MRPQTRSFGPKSHPPPEIDDLLVTPRPSKAIMFLFSHVLSTCIFSRFSLPKERAFWFRGSRLFASRCCSAFLAVCPDSPSQSFSPHFPGVRRHLVPFHLGKCCAHAKYAFYKDPDVLCFVLFVSEQPFSLCFSSIAIFSDQFHV